MAYQARIRRPSTIAILPSRFKADDHVWVQLFGRVRHLVVTDVNLPWVMGRPAHGDGMRKFGFLPSQVVKGPERRSVS